MKWFLNGITLQKYFKESQAIEKERMTKAIIFEKSCGLFKI